MDNLIPWSRFYSLATIALLLGAWNALAKCARLHWKAAKCVRHGCQCGTGWPHRLGSVCEAQNPEHYHSLFDPRDVERSHPSHTKGQVLSHTARRLLSDL